MSSDGATRPRDEMILINQQQKQFYEQVRRERSFDLATAGLLSRAWNRVRERIWAYQADVGMRDGVVALHRGYLTDIEQMRVMDLGCGEGSSLTMWLAEHAREYVGLDLAEYPVNELNRTFAAKSFTNARAYAMDFLANDFPDGHFDAIYAAAVLHHFKDTAVLVDELLRVLKPGGLVLSYDPLQTEPVNRLARAVYRKWQDDRDWEWPFTAERIELLRRHFEVESVQGLLGLSRFGLPFYLIPGLRGVGRAIAAKGVAFDQSRSANFGPAFYNCWHCALVLRKPASR